MDDIHLELRKIESSTKYYINIKITTWIFLKIFKKTTTVFPDCISFQMDIIIFSKKCFYWHPRPSQCDHHLAKNKQKFNFNFMFFAFFSMFTNKKIISGILRIQNCVSGGLIGMTNGTSDTPIYQNVYINLIHNLWKFDGGTILQSLIVFN